MRARRLLAVALASGTLLLGTACAGNDVGSSGSGSGDKGSVTISGQNFPEATLVASMYQQLLEKAGYSVTMKLVGTRDVYMKQFPGDVDIVPEYVAGIADFLNIRKNGADAKSITTSDPQETLSALKPLADAAKITMLQPAEATDANAFFVTKKFADQNSLKTLSDLGALNKPVVLAAAPDCEGRTDCAGGLSKAYGINISKVLPLGYASAQTYESVLKGESQVGETSTTDGSLASQGLVLLKDDKGIQPAQNLIPAVSTDFLKKHQDVESLLNGLMDKLTTDDLTTLNGTVGTDRQQPEVVAKQYLQDQGLL
ncbi:MAG: ABC transporter substrate-binding protein [Nocardioidaceae bacterium]